MTDHEPERPKRIQRRRSKGWRMPEGAVYVGRGSKWGNPFVVGRDGTRDECLFLYRALIQGYLCISRTAGLVEQQRAAQRALKHVFKLKGKAIACWCPLNKPCHADVLLELANPHD